QVLERIGNFFRIDLVLIGRAALGRLRILRHLAAGLLFEVLQFLLGGLALLGVGRTQALLDLLNLPAVLFADRLVKFLLGVGASLLVLAVQIVDGLLEVLDFLFDVLAILLAD